MFLHIFKCLPQSHLVVALYIKQICPAAQRKDNAIGEVVGCSLAIHVFHSLQGNEILVFVECYGASRRQCVIGILQKSTLSCIVFHLGTLLGVFLFILGIEIIGNLRNKGKADSLMVALGHRLMIHGVCHCQTFWRGSQALCSLIIIKEIIRYLVLVVLGCRH